MTASADGGAQAARKWPAAVRIIGGAAGGGMAMLIVMGVLVGLPVWLFVAILDKLSFTLVLLALLGFLGVGALALFLGGAVARLLVGPGLWRNWIGAAALAASALLGHLISVVLPHHYWRYDAHRGWFPASPPSPWWEHTSVGWVALNVIINGLFLLAAAWLAREGDRWAAGRLEARRQPPPPAQEVEA